MPDTAKLVNGCLLCGKAFKWIPVIFIVTIIVWSYYAFVIQLCFFFAEGNIAQQVFYVLIYHALLTMLAWSYWKTIFTPIGTVPKQFKVSSVDLERLEQAENQEVQKQILEYLARDLPVVTRTPHGVRYCEKCVHIKPDRSHHCSVCGTCVLKMDHHCPWVNNCVGFTNYKFFLLFLGYAFIYCIFIAFTSLPYFIQFWKSELTGNGKFHVLFLFFVATMFAISLISLWGYHIYLVLHNRSTLEAFRAPIFRSGPDKDGFSLGKSNNFIEVFGDRKLFWFLPISTSLRDGVIFPSRYPTTPVTMTSTPVTYYNSMDPTTSPLTTTTSPTTVPPDPAEIAINMGDGVSFPQRNLDEDEDALLGNRQRWMEEGQDSARVEDNSSYRAVQLGTLVEPV